MSTRYQKKTEEYTRQLKAGEQVEQIALFNAIPTMICSLTIALAAFIAGRFFWQHTAILLFTNLMSMWMMVDVARALYITQNSCIIVTNLRTFGQVGEKQVDLPHAQLQNVVLNRLLFLDGGDMRSCVSIRYASNRKELYHTIMQYRSAVQDPQ